MRGQLRDWNEEYQSCKELPKETIQERQYIYFNFNYINSFLIEL